MEKEILGTVYTNASDDFQRGLYPIARTIKASQHDLGVVMKEVRGGNEMESAILTPKRTEYGKAIRKQYESGAVKESRHNMTELEPRNDGISNTITTVQKDNLLLEVKQVGNLTENAQRENPQRRRVYDTDGLSPTLTSGMGMGGNLQPFIIDEVKQIGNIADGSSWDNPQAGRIYDTDGRCPTINTCQGGQREPKIICAMRGRNPDNPSDRTAGSPTEQRLEPNSQGICNTLTSVQKDNMVLENICINDRGFSEKEPQVSIGTAPTLRAETHGNLPKVIEKGEVCIGGLQEHQTARTDGISPSLTAAMGMGGGQTPMTIEKVCIKQATKDGYIECNVGGVADLSYPESKTRHGRVQENGEVCPTLTATETGVCRIESLYRIRKLTPLECWRLMDFSDEDFHKAESVNSNSQLYKQAGNSIVKNVLVAIFGQMIPGKEKVYMESEE